MKGIVKTLIVLAATASMALTATPASAAVQSRGRNCEGVQAYRCAWFNHDTSNGNLRGYGSVKDTTDGVDTLKVSVSLQALISGTWTTIATGSAGPASSGATGFTITGYTGLASCVHGRSYRSKVIWTWNSSSGTVYSGSVAPC